MIPDVEIYQHDNNGEFADIWLLTTSDLDDKIDRDEFDIVDGFKWDYLKNRTRTHSSLDFVNTNDIKPYFSGVARVIHFSTTGWNKKINKFDPYIDFSKNKFHRMREGEFKNGHLDGFGRIISGKYVEVGYYQEGKPFGKF